MGYGHWTRSDFENYSAAKGRAVMADGSLDARLTDRQIFQQKLMSPRLSPLNVVRECRDSKDHPNSLPVILALDVTGSMGAASAQVARKMNEVMTTLYDQVRDVEFMVMGIGDLAYDRAPIQISQFESDIRIAEQLDLIYMEHGGGGNLFESYTAAWYMGSRHTELDCLKRGRKGLIITMGDERLNPYLPRMPLSSATGDCLQADIDTSMLYAEAAKKFEIYHIQVCHRQQGDELKMIAKSFREQLAPRHYRETTVEGISDVLIGIIRDHAKAMNGAYAPIAEPEKTKHRDGLLGLIDWTR